MSNNNWKMPEPVFQRTSGSLPEDFAERVSAPSQPQTAPAVPVEKDATDEILSTLYAPPGETVEAPVVAPPPIQAVTSKPAIEAQPIISEQFSVAEIDTSTPVAPVVKGKGLVNLFFTIGIIIVLAIAAALAALVYFVFLRTPPETTFQ